MTTFKFSGRVFTLAAASLFAVGLIASTPNQAQAASKTGNFALGALAGVAGAAVLHNLNRNRRYQRRYYQPAPRRYYAPRRRYYAPARSYAPAAWSPGWYNYCSGKYRSFNPSTGYYLSYSGQYRFCR